MSVHHKLLPPNLTLEEFQAERRRVIEDLAAEGVWCFLIDPPIDTSWPATQQVSALIEHARVVACNDAMARMHGYRRGDELLGTRLSDILVSTDARNLTLLETFVSSGYRLGQVETHEINRQGESVWFLNSMVGILEAKCLLRVWGTQLDVTATKRLHEDAIARAHKLKQVLDHLDQVIFLKDAQYRYQLVNRRFLEIVGLKEEAVLGKTDFDIHPQHLAEQYRADDGLVLHQGRRVELEEQAQLRGQTHVLKVVKLPVADTFGRVTGILGSAVDVTAQRALESQLRHAQMLDAIGQLAGGVANDFNNMLTAILGNLDLVLRQIPPNEALRASLKEAEQAALRAADLVRKLLSFSRRQPLQLEPLDCTRFLKEVSSELQLLSGPTYQILLEAPTDLWTIRGDKTHLRQVLLNLVANAREAMPQGGVIRLEATNVHINDHEFRGKPHARPGDFVRIRVIDTGRGIPDEVRHRIFEPFITTKTSSEHALGLGLAMSYGIIERHSGWIEFTTEKNQGTTFTFFLPREQAPVPPQPEQPTALQGSETILFVEDEEIVRRLGTSILTRYGYRVIPAVDGQEALEVFLKHRRGIDLIILDLSMPRLSGRETYRRLRQLSATVPVVFTSGQADELYAQAEADPAQGCISKPYRAEELAALVRRVLDHHREEVPAS